MNYPDFAEIQIYDFNPASKTDSCFGSMSKDRKFTPDVPLFKFKLDPSVASNKLANPVLHSDNPYYSTTAQVSNFKRLWSDTHTYGPFVAKRGYSEAGYIVEHAYTSITEQCEFKGEFIQAYIVPSVGLLIMYCPHNTSGKSWVKSSSTWSEVDVPKNASYLIWVKNLL
jgi:hypothetical protein